MASGGVANQGNPAGVGVESRCVSFDPDNRFAHVIEVCGMHNCWRAAVVNGEHGKPVLSEVAREGFILVGRSVLPGTSVDINDDRSWARSLCRRIEESA